MSFLNLFTRECLQAASRAGDKEAVLREIAGLAVKSPRLEDVAEEEVFQRLQQREQAGSTGFEGGIAIPHCFFEDISDFIVGLLVTEQGIDFDAADNKPSQLFFFIIAPASLRNKHIRILSAISRMVKNPGVKKALLQAGNGDELYDLVNQYIQYRDESSFHTEYCQLIVYLQREDIFNDILEILSASSDGALSVVDSAGAGYYLHRLPLFSAFWNDDQKHFSRLLFCVVKKKLLNNVLRQIYSVNDNLGEEAGLLITASDLICSMGRVDY